jgi:GNAT superfamily N-acetyltransferase
MRAVVYGDIERFWTRVRPLYESDPVEHNVALIAFNAALADRTDVAGRRWLVAVENGDQMVGAVFTTDSTRPAGVSALPVECANTAAEALHGSGAWLGGIAGRAERTIAFAEAWTRITSIEATSTIHTRLYRLDTLAPPAVPGKARPAGPADSRLVGEWLKAFQTEVLHSREPDSEDPARAARLSMAAGNIHLLWDLDGVPVSHAMLRRPAAGLSRVSAVYTPPEHRRHGYAAAVTAAVSGYGLGRGVRELVLFADLANPTTNAIYQEIGYRPVSDHLEYVFTEVSATSGATVGSA